KNENQNQNLEPRNQNENREPRTPNPEPRPWFAWIHLYDPHEPYTPPEPFASRYRQDPYSGEIAYADAALGRFLDRLRGSALDRTLVVVASDHGESLGEYGERTHGLFAYEATLRVPLILWAPGAIRPGVVSTPARLVDLAPTILDLLGVSLPPVDGRSLRPRAAGEPALDDPGSYFEALNANVTRDWAPLKGMVRDRLKLVDLPIPGLYRLAAGPGRPPHPAGDEGGAAAHPRPPPRSHQRWRAAAVSPDTGRQRRGDAAALARLRRVHGAEAGARVHVGRRSETAGSPGRDAGRCRGGAGKGRCGCSGRDVAGGARRTAGPDHRVPSARPLPARVPPRAPRRPA